VTETDVGDVGNIECADLDALGHSMSSNRVNVSEMLDTTRVDAQREELGRRSPMYTLHANSSAEVFNKLCRHA
jgi:hypothetical protein